MGATHSSQRRDKSGKARSVKERLQNSNSLRHRPSKDADGLSSYPNHPQYNQSLSFPPPLGLGYHSPTPSHASHSSSLKSSGGRRRSSNQTAASVSTNPSSNFGTTLASDSHSSRYSEEGGDAQEFRWFNGRRYHNSDSLYVLPNDSEEVDRLHLQHYIFKMLMNEQNSHVKFPVNGRVIDLGCGAATWVMDMATELTTATFVGVDVSAIFPTAIHPPNCTFLKENFLHGVSQPAASFDAVFERCIAPGLTAELWQQTFQEAFRLLKPGGWFESVESDATAQDAGPFTNMCFDHVLASMATRDVDTRIVRSLDRIMVSVGFVDVQVKEYCIPLGEWGGKLGMLWKQNLMSILQTVKPHLSRAGRITEDQVGEMIQSMCKETRDHRAYQIIYVTYGRKPL